MKKHLLQPLWLPVAAGLALLAVLALHAALTGNGLTENPFGPPMSLMNGLSIGLIFYVFEYSRRRVPLSLSLGATRKQCARLLACERLLSSFSCAAITCFFIFLFRIPTAGLGFSLFLFLLFLFLYSMDCTSFLSVFTFRFTGKIVYCLLVILSLFHSMVIIALYDMILAKPEGTWALIRQWHLFPLGGILSVALCFLIVPLTEKMLSAYTVKL